MQPTGGNPDLNLACGDPECSELRPGDHPVLAFGERRES